MIIKHWLKVLSLGVILMVPSLSFARPLNDAIVAIVNNDVITLKDLKDYISGVYRQLKVENRSPAEIQSVMAAYEEKGVNQLIEDKLILAAATAKGIEIRPQGIDKRLKEIKDRYTTEEDFINGISSQGITVTDIRNKLINQMKSKYIVDLEVKEKIFVNPEMVTRYYNDHMEEFQSKTKYNLDSIYIPFDQSRNDALKKIKEARDRLTAGEDFEEVRKQYSQAPSVGALEEGQMVPAIEKQIFALRQGEISQPLLVENGVYLFKVNAITLGGKQSLEESKDYIYNKVYEQQFQDKFKTWADKLRSKAYVEIR